jgi:hypothetical protein
LGQQFDVLDAATDAHIHLMGEHKPEEMPAAPLPLSGDAKQIVVLREKQSAELRVPLQQFVVVRLARAVLLTRQHVDVAAAQPWRSPSVITAGT